ncbi:MAG: penicillin-binding protein 1A [Candidatus Methylomirabilia bacterium]
MNRIRLRIRRTRRIRSTPRRWPRRVALALASVFILGTLGVAASVFWVFIILPRSLPSVTELETFQPIQGSKLFDENDERIAEFQVERRMFVPLADIPQALKDAILAVEDSRFYSHYGVDPIGIARAIYQNFRRGRIVEGGSTITQQLAKVLFLTPDKSLNRKLKEAFLALELERRYSKDRILEMYLNQIYFGQRAYGVEAAARTYYGKSAAALALGEAALLAGLPKAPTSYSPFNHPEIATRRRSHVLNRMIDVGTITPVEASRAMATDLGLIPPEKRRTPGQYFIEYVRRLLAEQYGEDMVYKGGLNVYTTLSFRMQRSAERSLREGLKALAARVRTAPENGDREPEMEQPEGALITIEPQTGYIKAMVGGFDFLQSEFNRAVQAKRQPGSAFKPFVYVAALESGLTPATLIEDSPVSYPEGADGKPWEPENYKKRFRGLITLQEGLEHSVNVLTVKLQEQVGIDRTVGVARRLGVRSPLNRDLTMALGSSELSLLELTSAYGALANRGVWVRPTAIRYITGAEGVLLEEYIPKGQQALSPEVAYVVTHMLKGAVQRGTSVRAKALGRPVAGKTGTTNDYSNAWFVGFTPKLVTGVWVGHDRPRSLGENESGARAALPIWVTYMGTILVRTPAEDFQPPEGVVLVPIDLNPGSTCRQPVMIAFIRGTEPPTPCGRPARPR